MDELSNLELLELVALERMFGRRWKAWLRALWDRAITTNDSEVTLYRLRNTHGPTWLQSFNLGKVAHARRFELDRLDQRRLELERANARARLAMGGGSRG